jgi:RES domain-containing protein
MAGLRPARLEPTLLTAWRGIAYCHVPADEPLRLDRLVSADGDDDRWNGPGEPTVYLALDLGTAVGELARHAELPAGAPPWRRRIIGLSIDVDGLVDLRRPEVRDALGIDREPAAFRDRELTRRVASNLRSDEACAGLLVPSMTFLDDAARGNLVVFAERFGDGIGRLIDAMVEAGLVELRPPRQASASVVDMKRGRSPGGKDPQGHETGPAAEEGLSARVADR